MNGKTGNNENTVASESMATKKIERQKERLASSKRNKYIMGMTYFYVVLFVALIAYIGYFMVYESPDIVNSTYNQRLTKLSETITRGKLLASDGSILAFTDVSDDGTETRQYPYGSTFAHVVGYSTRGETGLEAASNYYLLTSHEDTWSKLKKQFTDKPVYGDAVVSTLDVDLQEVVYKAMGDYNGACVVMEPSTGKILAMVSKPDYNPNSISEIYDKLISDSSNSNLVNRATQGLYSPGSTFKIVTLLQYIRENPNTYEDFSYNCTGSITYDGKTVKCSAGAHGVVDAKEAFAVSCNGAFITMGMDLKLKSFKKTAESLLFNQDIPYDLTVKKSQFNLTTKSSDWEIMQTVFGQGTTLVTPLHNAMILSAIANGGVMMKPYLIDSVQDVDGNEVEQFLPEAYGEVMTSEEAEILKEFMVSCVNDGTGDVVQSDDYQAAAKTGSAQTNTNKQADAWFVAFAPADNPQVVVSVVLEEAGSGGSNAGPIAKKIFDALLVAD
jgi:cell division protein FtsI/penicillin-binding protein 2